MKPPLQVTAPDWGPIEAGDPKATSDAIRNLYGVVNQLSTQIAGRIGLWQSVTFDAAMFTTNGAGLWTVAAGDVEDFSYIRIDDLLVINLSLLTTVIGNGTTTELRVAAPGGFVLKGSHGVRSGNTVWNGAGPIADTGALFVQGGGTFISMQRWDGVAAAGYPQSGGGGTAKDFYIGFFGVFQILPVSGN